MVKRTIQLGISFPNEIVQRIESERGDVSRSRFLQRIIERYYKDWNLEENKVK